MKILQIVEQAFRTLVEEQDDTILWLSLSMRSAGAELEVLLSGHAAYYAVQQKRQPVLSVGRWQQRAPADLVRDLGKLLQQEVPVYVVEEDLSERGLAGLPLHPGIVKLRRAEQAELYERVDQVWQW